MAIVSREAPAQFRVRGYLATLVEKRRGTVVAWVWDVYDIDQRRAVRLTGEEKTSGAGRGTWAAADERCFAGSPRAAWTSSPRSWVLRPPRRAECRTCRRAGGPNFAATDDAASHPNGATLAFSTNSRQPEFARVLTACKKEAGRRNPSYCQIA